MLIKTLLVVSAVALTGCPAGSEICGNGVDDDLDGLTDCEEPLCRCGDVELCDGGIDEDLDGFTDCEDSDCALADGCSETVCDDAVDDDLDGLTDCEDQDCDVTGVCVEACEDGRDNDADGLVDCEDADCVDAPSCGELLCHDGLDDDGDLLVDCDDDDCWGLTCHPRGVHSMVTDGTMNMVLRSNKVKTHTYGSYSVVNATTTVEYPCGPFGSSTATTFKTSGSLQDVRGQVRVYVPTTGGTATETCNWGFAGGQLDGVDGAVGIVREGFFLEDSQRCHLAGSAWLPQELTRNGQLLQAQGLRRYAVGAPDVTRGSTSANRTSTFRASCYRYFSTLGRTSTVYGAGVFGDETSRTSSSSSGR